MIHFHILLQRTVQPRHGFPGGLAAPAYAVHRRAKELAEERGQSLSAVVADLAVRGLAQLSEPVKLEVEPITRLPVLSIGRRVTSAGVADLLDDE